MCTKANLLTLVVVKESAGFIAGAKQGVQAANAQKARTPWKPLKAFKDRFLKTEWGRGLWGHDQLVDALLIGCWWGNRSQHPQPSGSSWSGVYRLVVTMQLTSSTRWGFQYLQNSSKSVAQNSTYCPWGGTKGPCLCLMAKLVLFCLAWLLSFVSAFSHFSD